MVGLLSNLQFCLSVSFSMVSVYPISYLLFTSILPLKNRKGWFVEEIFGLKKGYIYSNIKFA